MRREDWGDVLGDAYNALRIEVENSSANWSGRRESNPYYQLGNLIFRSFISNTYKIAQKKCTCMPCIPCMHCLICVSLGDVWGTVFLDTLLFTTAVSTLTFRPARSRPILFVCDDKILLAKIPLAYQESERRRVKRVKLFLLCAIIEKDLSSLLAQTASANIPRVSTTPKPDAKAASRLRKQIVLRLQTSQIASVDQDSRYVVHGERPTFVSNSSKRGSERKGSNMGSTFTVSRV